MQSMQQDVSPQRPGLLGRFVLHDGVRAHVGRCGCSFCRRKCSRVLVFSNGSSRGISVRLQALSGAMQAGTALCWIHYS